MKRNNIILTSILGIAIVVSILFGTGFLSLISGNSVSLNNKVSNECSQGVQDVGRLVFSDGTLKSVDMTLYCESSGEKAVSANYYARNEVNDWVLIQNFGRPFVERHVSPRPIWEKDIVLDAQNELGFVDLGMCYPTAVSGGICGISNIQPNYEPIVIIEEPLANDTIPSNDIIPPLPPEDDIPPIPDDIVIINTPWYKNLWGGITGNTTLNYSTNPKGAGFTTGAILIALIFAIVFIPFGRGKKK